MTCLNCKYYLNPKRDRMFCGLGMSPRDAQSENFCSKKEEGKPDKIELKSVSIWDYDTDKRLEQCPSSIKNLCNKINEKIYKFKRTHETINKTDRKVIITIWFEDIYWYQVENLFPTNCTYTLNYENKCRVLSVNYTESKRKAYVEKKTKRGRTVV